MNLQRTPESGHAGLTILELLVALTLSAMLLTALVGVMSALQRQQTIVVEKHPYRPWRRAAMNQLHWDFQNAKWVAQTDDGLHLVGYGGRDFQSGHVNHRPAQIDYLIVGNDDRRWLCRRERHTDEFSNKTERTEFVLADVSQIRMERLDEEIEDVVADPLPIGGDFFPVPSSFRIIMVDGATPPSITEQEFYFR